MTVYSRRQGKGYGIRDKDRRWRRRVKGIETRERGTGYLSWIGGTKGYLCIERRQPYTIRNDDL